MSVESDSALPRRLPPAARRRPAVSVHEALLVAAIVALGLSVALPWWSETQVSPGPGSVTSTQNYSPLTGVTGSCSPECSPFFTAPPVGPFQGTHSFRSVGLNQTATLYNVCLALVVLGAAGSAVALLAIASQQPRRRFRAAALVCALAASALACGLLASLQPSMFSHDVSSTFSQSGSWTATPSPETSFWGACSPGPANGICASGWSASWGPGLGWFMIVAGTVLLLTTCLLLVARPRQPVARDPNSPARPSASGPPVAVGEVARGGSRTTKESAESETGYRAGGDGPP